MRFITIAGGFIILVFNIIVSFHHTLLLFRSGGFSGVYAYMAVGAVEILFLMSALTLIVNRVKKRKPGGFTILGGLIGVGVVGWSNINAGVEYGVTGIILGALVPATLVVAEGIVSRELFTNTRIDTPPKESTTTANTTKPDTNLENTTKTPATNSPGTKETNTNLVNGTSTKNTNGESGGERKHGDTNTKKEYTTNIKTSTKPPVTNTNDTNLEKVKLVAIKFKEQHGKLPGRTKLKQLANCKEWHARMVLEELKHGA